VNNLNTLISCPFKFKEKKKKNPTVAKSFCLADKLQFKTKLIIVVSSHWEFRGQFCKVTFTLSTLYGCGN
jgi:aromatic ring-opening dioxygenase catalytic subunit (LigB family)